MIDRIYAWGKPFFDFVLYLHWQTDGLIWPLLAALAIVAASLALYFLGVTG